MLDTLKAKEPKSKNPLKMFIIENTISGTDFLWVMVVGMRVVNPVMMQKRAKKSQIITITTNIQATRPRIGSMKKPMFHRILPLIFGGATQN